MSKKNNTGLVTGVKLSSNGDSVELTIRIPLEEDKCCDPGMLQIGIYNWEVATKVEVKEI